MNWNLLEKKLDSTKMKENIQSQGRSLSLTINNEIENISRISSKVRNCRNFIFSGCGDKHIVDLAAQFVWNKISSKPLSVIQSRLFVNYPSYVDKHTCMVFVTQSGTTFDTIEACKLAIKRNAKVVCITNLKENKESSIVDICQNYSNGYVIKTHTEIYPEESLPSTSTFHTSLTALNLFSIFVNNNQSRLAEIQVNYIPKLVDILSRSEKLKEFSKNVAKRLKNVDDFYVLGDGPRYVSARKAARIMFMEGSKTNAYDIESEEFIHSLIETIEGKPKNLILLKPLDFLDKPMQLYKIIKNTWPQKMVIEIDPFDFLDSDAKSLFSSDDADALSPFIYTIPLEWISYYLALLKGKDPGKGKLVNKIRSHDNVKNFLT
ncbi:MAG: SIS domain-containing protein [Candidatus Aenigmatarchaeota archaeon]|nr:SIS domain-containing protein [Candidatus Aenigmarchaeota archaeon]